MKQHLLSKKHINNTDDVSITNYDKQVYKCRECKKTFGIKSNMTRHIKLYHKSEEILTKQIKNDESNIKKDNDELNKLMINSVLNIKDEEKCKEMAKLLMENAEIYFRI
jgi:hypothetical protein